MVPAVNLLLLSSDLRMEDEKVHSVIKIGMAAFGTLVAGMGGYLVLDLARHPEAAAQQDSIPDAMPKLNKAADVVIDDYTRGDYPALFARFGKVFTEINADRLAAAKIAASDERCDTVANVQIASHTPAINRKYWAECSNLTRFRFDQSSIAQGKAITVQTEADMIRDGLVVD